jgi:c-di-GMP-binding flagellar brake protein YcgR
LSPDVNESGENVEEVEQQRRINYFLKRLSKEPTWLDVRVDAHAEHFRTVVLEDQSNREELILDELIPRTGQRGLAVGSRLSLAARFQDGLLRFNTEVLGNEMRNGAYINHCIRPCSMRYLQRRSERRIVVGYAASIPAALTLDEGVTLNGRVFDISSGGLAIVLNQGLAGHNNEPDNDGLENQSGTVQIWTHGDELLKRKCTICSVLATNDAAVSYIRVRFDPINPGEEERTLRRLVMTWERESIRRIRQSQA